MRIKEKEMTVHYGRNWIKLTNQIWIKPIAIQYIAVDALSNTITISMANGQNIVIEEIRCQVSIKNTFVSYVTANY